MKNKKKHFGKAALGEAIRQFIDDRGVDPEITYPQLRSKVLGGYTYQIGTKTPPKKKKDEQEIVAYTGKGGALLFLETCEEMGMPAAIAGDNVLVLIGTGSFPLSILEVRKDVKNDESEKPAVL